MTLALVALGVYACIGVVVAGWLTERMKDDEDMEHPLDLILTAAVNAAIWPLTLAMIAKAYRDA